MVRTSPCCLVSRVWAKRFAHPNIFGKTNTGAGACLDMAKILSAWQGPHFPVLRPRPGRKHLSPHPFSKTEVQVPKLAWTCEIFLAHGQDLSFQFCAQGLCERVCHRKHFCKKRTPAPELDWTCQKFSAHDRDLAFLSCAQELAESICPHTRFQKEKPGCRSLLGPLRFS